MDNSITVGLSSVSLRLVQYLLIVQNKLPPITLLLTIQPLTATLHRQSNIIIQIHIPTSQIST